MIAAAAERAGEVIVTIDGPSGAGKSTIARALARRLGFRCLDTGAIFRAFTLRAQRAGVDLAVPDAVARAVRASEVAFVHDDAGGGGAPRVLLDGEDVTEAIRSASVTGEVSRVAANREVRRQVERIERRVAAGGRIVCEGRDMGTVVFPDAPVKLFLDASLEERARRRHAELARAGFERPFAVVLAEVAERDRKDTERAEAPLRRAPDAHLFDSSGVPPERVVERLEALVRERMAEATSPGRAGPGGA